LADVVLSMGRKEHGQHVKELVRGLLLDGERKSIESVAIRVPDRDVQALQQFVNQSPWSSSAVRASLARKVEREFVPEAYWLLDEVSFSKEEKTLGGSGPTILWGLGENRQLPGGSDAGFGDRRVEYPSELGVIPPRAMDS